MPRTPKINQEEVDYYFKKYNVENLKKEEPELVAKVLKHFKYYDRVIVPLKKRFIKRIMKRMNDERAKKKNRDPETTRLKTELAAALSEITRLKAELKENRENSLAYHFSVVEEEIHKHHLYFNPYPVAVPATHNNKSLKYKIGPTQVICIISSDRAKTIYLSEKVENYEGELRKTDKIVINNNQLSLEKLRQLIDSLGFHLVQVSKGEIVNLGYYRLSKTVLQFKGKAPHNACASFGIGSNYMGNFQQRKDHYDGLHALASLHKSLVPYKK